MGGAPQRGGGSDSAGWAGRRLDPAEHGEGALLVGPPGIWIWAVARSLAVFGLPRKKFGEFFLHLD